MPRFTYRLDLAYDGSQFVGFQQQVGQRTVESALLEALRPFLPDLPRVAVGGRTDKGVHALNQVVSFWARAKVDEEVVVRSIEDVGAGALAVVNLREVPRSFHASFAATRRSYIYRSPLSDVDIGLLDAMFGALVGHRCFHAFARRTPVGQSTDRTIYRARVLADGGGRARFELEANRFLRQQIRVLVATAIREMRAVQNGGRADPDVLVALSERGDRACTAPPACADGLYLASVSYT